MSKRKILILSLVFMFGLSLFFCFSRPTQAMVIKLWTPRTFYGETEFVKDLTLREDLLLQGIINPWALTRVHDLFAYGSLNVWGPIINNVPGGDPLVIGDNLDVHGEISRKWGPLKIKDGIEQKGGEKVKFSGKVEAKKGLTVTGDIAVTGKVDGVDLSTANLGILAGGIDFSELTGTATDAQIPDTITTSNYLPLSGGTLTGNLSLAAGKKVDGIDVSTIPSTYLPLTGGTVGGNLTVDGKLTVTGAIDPTDISYSGTLSGPTANFSDSITVANNLTTGGLDATQNVYLGAALSVTGNQVFGGTTYTDDIDAYHSGNVNLTIDAAGTGTITLANTSTGSVRIVSDIEGIGSPSISGISTVDSVDVSEITNTKTSSFYNVNLTPGDTTITVVDQFQTFTSRRLIHMDFWSQTAFTAGAVGDGAGFELYRPSDDIVISHCGLLSGNNYSSCTYLAGIPMTPGIYQVRVDITSADAGNPPTVPQDGNMTFHLKQY